MTLFLADSNVLLDVAIEDPVWADWSQDKLDTASRLGRVIINPVIYAELSLAYDNIETLDLILAEADIELLELPRAALFLAGRVFRSTAGVAAGERAYFRTSSSGRMPRWRR